MYFLFCEICGEKNIDYRCNVCRRYVCKKHFDSTKMRCVLCIDSECDVCRNFLAVSRCYICGRKICSSCSVDIDNVRRICFYCLINSRHEIFKKR